MNCVQHGECRQIKWTQPLKLKYIHLRICAANAIQPTFNQHQATNHPFLFRLHSEMELSTSKKINPFRNIKYKGDKSVSSHSNNDNTWLDTKICLPFVAIGIETN